MSLQCDQGADQSLGNQQTAVINLGVGSFVSPQAAGATTPDMHTLIQIQQCPQNDTIHDCQHVTY